MTAWAARRPRHAKLLGLAGALVGTSVLAVGCGKAGAGAGASSRALGLACTRITDVLSDGPDRTADPVGYALAQVTPLREVHTRDAALRLDINALADAYEAVYRTGNGKAAQAAVQKAGDKVDTICPGAF
ncbi:MAG TPA: hypothetical protein VL984_16595 [Acidimicrobiales bacterium]|nr:hypothetical protein [Acidimicrobiales bacterium]